MDSALLDTDILSEVFKGKDPIVAARAAAYIEEHGRFTITSVTVLEVVSGWHRLQREDRVQEFLERLGHMDVLPLAADAAAQAGRIEADLERGGKHIGRADSMIAAIAIIHALPLVTGNTQHYLRIQDLGYPLRLDDWRGATPPSAK